MISKRSFASSAIKIGPGSAEGFDSAASRSGPEAVRVRGALDAEVGVGRGVGVALGATDGPCAFGPGAVGFDGVLATARNLLRARTSWYEEMHLQAKKV